MSANQPRWKQLLAGMLVLAAFVGGPVCAADGTDTKALSSDPAREAVQPADSARPQREPAALPAQISQLEGLLKRIKELDPDTREAAAKIEAELAELKKRLAARDQKQPDPARKQGDQKGGQAAPRIRVFRLKHSELEEVHAILLSLLQRPLPPEGSESGMEMMSRMMQGGEALGEGGGLGMVGMSMISRSGQRWWIAMDPRTRSVIVRGSEQDLQTAADIIALIDTPPNRPLPRVKNLRAFRLQFAEAEDVQAVLQTLGIGVGVASLPTSGLLLVHGPESVLQEVVQLIEVLDVMPDPIPEPKKETFPKK